MYSVRNYCFLFLDLPWIKERKGGNRIGLKGVEPVRLQEVVEGVEPVILKEK